MVPDIDDREIFFQRQGYADAITDPDVLAAIALGHDGKIAVTYVEWGDSSSQEVVVPWTIIDGHESASRFAEVLMSTPRLAYGRNAIGTAIAYAHLLIESNTMPPISSSTASRSSAATAAVGRATTTWKKPIAATSSAGPPPSWSPPTTCSPSPRRCARSCCSKLPGCRTRRLSAAAWRRRRGGLCPRICSTNATSPFVTLGLDYGLSGTRSPCVAIMRSISVRAKPASSRWAAWASGSSSSRSPITRIFSSFRRLAGSV